MPSFGKLSSTSSSCCNNKASFMANCERPRPRRLSFASQSAPVKAIAQVSRQRNFSPPIITSRPAAPASFPSKALPILSASLSAAPEYDTPYRAYPLRPKSCTVVSGPGDRICIHGVSGGGNTCFTTSLVSTVSSSEATNLTKSPALSKEGGSLEGSNRFAGVRPSMYQPPGVSIVYTPVWPPAMPTVPFGTFWRGVCRRGTLAKTAGKPPMYGKPPMKPRK
mmetsp:Transcript_45054/g.82879  ORF Transcript_45054/g.82879 Transcript_45054/m.82879 type:complete len:222 (+) Transcript_45054:193-858(+)